MVLESIVADLVNRFLGDYIENLNKSQLSLSIWGGDIVLNNLFVKESLLDELELPVKVVHGNIGQLTLKIPWKNLYTEPTVVVLEGIYVIAVPRTSVAYNEEKELRADWEAKKKQLERIEEIKKKEAEKDNINNPSVDSFTEKLVANVIKNLQVTITNIHLRYEDCVTDPRNPFSVGFTLHKLSLQTTDEEWSVKVIKEATSIIYKMLELDSFSVYWNCASEMFSIKDKSLVQSHLKETIATNFKQVDHMYLIKPMVSAAKLIINMRPERSHYTLPKLFLDVIFKEIAIGLAKNQYQMLIEFMDSLERLTIADKYRKYKPRNTSKITTSNQRWKFAYTCILEDTVKRRRRMWAWTNILDHRKLCRRYGDLYKAKLKTSKPTADLLAEIEQCEKKLDVFNITMMRKQAEIAAKKEGGNKDGGDAGSGWFSWFGFGQKRPKTEAETKSAADRLKDVLSEDEKRKLYDAIGYQEVPDADFPKEYVAVKLHMQLSGLILSLSDTTDSPLQQISNVLRLELQDIDAVINQRPSANAVGLSASLQALNILGIAAEDNHVTPVLATSRDLTGGVPSRNEFVRLQFDTNPLNSDCDTAISLAVQQFEVKYDARTIIALVDFFKPPKDVYALQLQAAAMAKLQSVKGQTATGLLYAINQQKFTKLTITMKPTCIIIPENGIYRQNCQMLVLDLGELSVETEKPTAVILPQGLLSLDEVKKQAFNKFNIRIKSIQMLMANAGEKWEDVRTVGSSSLHFLRPMAFNVDLFQSVIPDPGLPKIRVIGSLPTLSLSLSDKRLCEMIKLLSGIPFPEGAPPEEVEEAAVQVKVPELVSITEDDELSMVMDAIVAKQNVIKDGSAFLNTTSLELEFEINEISVTLSRHMKDATDKPLLKIVVESLGVQLTVRDFDTSFRGHLGGIYVQYLLMKASDELIAWYADKCRAKPALDNGPLINLINTPIMDGKAFKLLTVEVLMANKKHPNFSTTYQNTLQNITMELSVLEILLHQEALLSTLALLQGIQGAVEKPEVPAVEPLPLRRSRRSSIASSVSYAVKRIERRRKGRESRKKVTVEIIDVALNAQLNSLSIAVCNQERILTDVKVKNLGVFIALQKSTTTIRALLKDIVIFDHVPDPIYPKILSVDGGDLFKMSIIVNNGATEGSKYLDMRIVDTEIMLETACIKVIFLNKFVQDLLEFVNHFEKARENLSNAGLAMANQAAAAAQSLSSRSSRLSLDVKVKAPVIIIPQNTRSTNAVVLDFGQLTITNAFQITGSGVKSHDGFPPVLDAMSIELSQMKVSRALLLGTEMKAECQIIEPVTLSLKLTRNLSASWYHGHPDTELNGKLQRFMVLMSQGDLKTILSILNENVQEGASKSPSPAPKVLLPEVVTPVDFHPSPSFLQRERSSGHLAPLDEVHSTLKLNVSIDEVKIELYNGDSDLSVGRSKHDPVQLLARFRLSSFALLANVLSDTSMKATIALYSCELEDARPGREAGITKMLAHKEPANAHETVNMVDIGFIQDASSNKDVDVKVNGLQVVICIGYVMELKDFFLNGLPATNNSVAPASAQSASEPTTSERPTSSVIGGETKLQLAVIQPEIILVENPMNIDSHAVIMTMNTEAMMRSSVIHQIVKATVSGLSICSGIYNPGKRESCKTQLLVPLSIELNSNAPSGKDQHVEVIFLQNVVLNISAASIRAVTATLSSMTPGKVQGTEDELQKIPNDLWVVKKLKDLNFWFLQSGDTAVANSGTALLEKELQNSEQGTCQEEQLVLKKCRIIVKLLGGVGHQMVPFIITDISLRSVDVRNWSSHLQFFCELTLEMCCYNDQLAVWEPLIEPIETDMRHRPWELAIEMRQTDLLNLDEDTGTTAPAQVIINVASCDILQLTVTKTALKVYSNLAQSFSEAYNLKEPTTTREEVIAPYVLKNETGMFISVKPGSSFQITEDAVEGQYGVDHGQALHLNLANSTKGSLAAVVEVIHDHPKTLSLIFEDLNNAKREITVKRAEKRAFSLEQRASSPREIWQIIAQIDMAYGYKVITLRSTVQVQNTLPYAVELYYKLSDDAMGRCGDVEAGKTTSILCEAVYTPPFEIFFKPSMGCFYESVASCEWKDVALGSTELIECTASKADFRTVFFMVIVKWWKKMMLEVCQDTLEQRVVGVLDQRAYVLCVINTVATPLTTPSDERTCLTMEPVLFESTLEASAKSYLITLSPTVVLRNFLPTVVTCKLEDVDTIMSLEPGCKTPLLNAKPSHSVLQIFVSYQSREWTGRINLEREPSNMTVIAFEALDGNTKLTMDLSMHCEKQDSGSFLMSLYCPYWMINKTDLELQYKSSNEHIVNHQSNNNDVVLFLCKSSGPGIKKKLKRKFGSCCRNDSGSVDRMNWEGAVTDTHSEDVCAASTVCISLKIGDSEWSSNFSLDTVGSVGKVECKFNNQPVYDEVRNHKTASSYKSVVGVQIRLCSNSMTKIVTFSPFFIVMNQAQFVIECKELLPNAPWLEVPSDGCIPFWPVNPETQKLMVARIKGTMLETLPFCITESHTTFLQLYHDYGGINVECAPSEGSISIIFNHYCPGFATALLINQTSFAVIEYHQKDMKSRCLTLNPGEAAMYTWQNPTGKRQLTWSYGGKSCDNELDKDAFEHFGGLESSDLYWVSFLDGMQRVLLFTEDLATVLVAQQAGELERVEQEINLNLLGIGLSLVSDDKAVNSKEIAYMAITSSGVIWEKEKKKYFKPIKMKQNLSIECAYQNYLSELLTSDFKTEAVKAIERKLEVNFESMVMLKPQKNKIRRSFHNGISLCYRVSPHQTQLHLKVHRLQLDNQGAGAVFPVVLAQLPVPKTVAKGSGPRPFAELSVLIRKSQFSNVMQIRYCKILLQEFAVKVDQGFLGGILSMFALSTADEDARLIEFNKDCELSKLSLMTDVIQTSSAGVQHFFDELHCSPIKVHLSFSLYGVEKNGSGDAAPHIQWQFLNLFLQSVGIVLTDIQDVVFKLGYFERKHAFYNQAQLTSELTRHYAQQAFRQMYVLVLGLDVLGNPFGVMRGLADGIEDFFYEPYQGAIQGPEEFAEGLAIGVKSLLGHAVGGAAGAVSRITGALGKGIATLTLDENYQRNRREAINKRPANLKEGLARGGQGLVMGVVHGVTGIVTKPIEGARQEGVKGFFKGAGKGLVGVIARPASGVIDFASSSFDGIRRFTELSDEVTRLRPPRFFQLDGILRAYCYREAEGNQILQDVEKKKFASELYIGHVVTSPDCRHILVVTEKRLIYIGKGDVFGQWNCVWDYTWAQLKEPPQFTPRGIQILLKERQKKLIGSSTIGKLVVVQEKDKKYAELLVGKMRIAMSTVTIPA